MTVRVLGRFTTLWLFGATRSPSRTECLHPRGETCTDGGGWSVAMFVVLGLVSAAFVYGVLFMRRDNVRPLLRRATPVLAVAALVAIVVIAFSW